jgi:hypothetical protein
MEYTFIEKLPFIGKTISSSGSGTLLFQYLGAMYAIILTTSAILAFFMLVVGGVQYSYTALSPSAKGAAKERMKNALLGLLIVFGAWLILNTINPDLVRLDLAIKPITVNVQTGTIDTSAPPNPGSGPGSAGIVTSIGTPGCPTCVTLDPSIPAKGVGTGCKGVPQCTIDPRTGQKLLTLNESLKSQNINWQVTEMYPPTRDDHYNSCHRDGTCVDASCRGARPDTVCTDQEIIQMGKAAQASGLSPKFEVKTQARMDALLNAGMPKELMESKPLGNHISGEHFSLYNTKQ